MPDWEQIVAERLERLKLSPEERREVIAEIAAHLDECYLELRDAGSPDPEGYTLAQVRDWNALSRKIRRAKEGRMSFARRVMMPGLAALFLAQVAQLMLLHSSVVLHGSPLLMQFRWAGVTHAGPLPGAFYLPWLLTLPLAGALGAWLTRRTGASPVQRLTAALYPAIYPGVLIFTLFRIFTLFVFPQRPFSEFKLANETWMLLYWVVAPAIACGIGALPFLSNKTEETADA